MYSFLSSYPIDATYHAQQFEKILTVDGHPIAICHLSDSGYLIDQRVNALIEYSQQSTISKQLTNMKLILNWPFNLRMHCCFSLFVWGFKSYLKIFIHMEMSPLLVRANLYLNQHSSPLKSERFLQRATPTVTWGIRL